MSARATLIGAALILGSVCMTAPAGAQQATERYIPLGRSPGLSGTSTYIGRIASADSRTRTLDVVGPAGLRSVAVTDRTVIWLDRTQLGASNTTGTFADCLEGRAVEVKYQDPEGKRLAEWIKLRLGDLTPIAIPAPVPEPAR